MSEISAMRRFMTGIISDVSIIRILVPVDVYIHHHVVVVVVVGEHGNDNVDE